MPNNIECRDVSRIRVLGDSWYATSIRDVCDPLDEVVARRCSVWIQRMARRPGVVRNLLLFRFGRQYELTVTCLLKGTWVFLLLQTVFGGAKRRLIVFEFGFVPPRGPWRWLRQLPEFLTLRYALERTLLRAQVMTPRERLGYSVQFRLPESRFVLVPWPQSRATDCMPDVTKIRAPKVLSSGRVGCDWVTLFKAAQDTRWHLTVVCATPDHESVMALADAAGATVLKNIPLEQHQQLLEDAAVYVISVAEQHVSVGQIRAMNAIRAGVPIVASKVIGLEGYLVDNETALLVPPGDHLAMRAAVERLLADVAERQRLAARAFEIARDRTFEGYLATLKAMVQAELAET